MGDCHWVVLQQFKMGGEADWRKLSQGAPAADCNLLIVVQVARSTVLWLQRSI